MLVTAEGGDFFSAALEQAEAYHRAAATAGPAVSPTLLYYSLVQFGKAMHFAAGSNPGSLPTMHGLAGAKHVRVADPPPTYPLIRRGAKGELLTAVETDDPPSIEDRFFARELNGHRGSASTFGRVQKLLGEKSKKFTTDLASVIAGHPDCADLFADLRDHRPIALRAIPAEYDWVRRRLRSTGLALEIIYGPEELDPDDLAERFSRIPFPEGWEPVAETGGIRAGNRSFVAFIQWRPNPVRHADQPWIADYSGSVMNMGQISWLPPGGMPADEHGFQVVCPNAPTGERWSRLTWWWVLLHALGDAARYHPADWAEAIDLRRSPIAADLIELLDRAARFMPDLGLWGLRQAQQSKKPPPVEHGSF